MSNHTYLLWKKNPHHLLMSQGLVLLNRAFCSLPDFQISVLVFTSASMCSWRSSSRGCNDMQFMCKLLCSAAFKQGSWWNLRWSAAEHNRCFELSCTQCQLKPTSSHCKSHAFLQTLIDLANCCKFKLVECALIDNIIHTESLIIVNYIYSNRCSCLQCYFNIYVAWVTFESWVSSGQWRQSNRAAGDTRFDAWQEVVRIG